LHNTGEVVEDDDVAAFIIGGVSTMVGGGLGWLLRFQEGKEGGKVAGNWMEIKPRWHSPWTGKKVRWQR
jgi:hypothetical protein